MTAAAVGFQHVLSAKDMAGIRDKEAFGLTPAQTADGRGERSGQVAFLPYLIPRMWDVIRSINERFFGFELEGVEPPQYALYRAGDHFDWHVDQGSERCRKLSLTVQLSSPQEYSGGDLEVYDGAETITAEREPGSLLAFPSWTLHRVAPVTDGERRALVVWAYGAPFR